MMVGGFAAAGRQHSFGSSRTRQTELSGNQRDSSRFSMLFGASQGSMDRAVADIHSQHFKGVEIDWTARLPPESLFDKDVVIDKKGYGGAYVSRRMVTTSTHIYFCEVGSVNVIDEVALRDIASVMQLRPVHHILSQESDSSLRANAGASGNQTPDDKGLIGNAGRSFRSMKRMSLWLMRSESTDCNDAAGTACSAACGATPAQEALPSDVSMSTEEVHHVNERTVSVRKDSLRPAPSLRTLAKEASREQAQMAFKLQPSGSGHNHSFGRAHSINELCELGITLSEQEGGRQIRLRTETAADCVALAEYLTEAANGAFKAEQNADLYGRVRASLGRIYNHDLTQMLVALLIFLSFITNVLEVQLDPRQEDAELTEGFLRADTAFTILFTVEVAMNLVVHSLPEFAGSSWNVFDLVVVVVSLVSLFSSSLGSATAVRSLRLFRAFRVLRIFGRLHDIRNILAGIAYSLVPVSNAFAILALVMCVYAIVGVQLFHEQQKDAFGNFGVALYTIFAASTMDGWQELVVIPFISEEEAGLSNSVPQNGMLIAFFVSFFLIVGWTLLPVIVAILLENFSYSTHAQQAKEDREHQAKAGYLNKIQHCLDPLLEVLAQNESELDLTQNITNLFHNLIGDPEGDTLSLEAFATNLRAKRFRNGAHIHISSEEFSALLREGGVSLDHKGCLTMHAFDTLIRVELRAYVQRQLAREQFLTRHQGSDAMAALLMAIKDMSVRLTEIESGRADSMSDVLATLTQVTARLASLEDTLGQPASARGGAARPWSAVNKGGAARTSESGHSVYVPDFSDSLRSTAGARSVRAERDLSWSRYAAVEARRRGDLLLPRERGGDDGAQSAGEALLASAPPGTDARPAVGSAGAVPSTTKRPSLRKTHSVPASAAGARRLSWAVDVSAGGDQDGERRRGNQNMVGGRSENAEIACSGGGVEGVEVRASVGFPVSNPAALLSPTPCVTAGMAAGIGSEEKAAHDARPVAQDSRARGNSPSIDSLLSALRGVEVSSAPEL